ncbi:MAG: hypothetical protein WC889_05905 [Myxococcota bacterium]|jgi:hypothetical protein
MVAAAYSMALLVLAASVLWRCAVLLMAWRAWLVGKELAGDDEAERIVASQITDPVSFILVAWEGESGAQFAGRVRAALSTGHPLMEVVVPIRVGWNDGTRELAAVFGLVPVRMVCRRQIPMPEVDTVWRSPLFRNLTVVSLSHEGQDGLLDAAVNFASYPLLCFEFGQPLRGSVVSMVVPFVEDPIGCQCVVGPLAPSRRDDRGGAFWMYNAERIALLSAVPASASRLGVPVASILASKSALVSTGGFTATGGRGEVIVALSRTGSAGSVVATRRCTGTAATGRGGLLSREWNLGLVSPGRLGVGATAVWTMLQVAELLGWLLAAAAVAAGVAGAASFAVVIGGGVAARLLLLGFEEMSYHTCRGVMLFRAIGAALVEPFGTRQAVLAVRAVSGFTGLYGRLRSR